MKDIKRPRRIVGLLSNGIYCRLAKFVKRNSELFNKLAHLNFGISSSPSSPLSHNSHPPPPPPSSSSSTPSPSSSSSSIMICLVQGFNNSKNDLSRSSSSEENSSSGGSVLMVVGSNCNASNNIDGSSGNNSLSSSESIIPSVTISSINRPLTPVLNNSTVLEVNRHSGKNTNGSGMRSPMGVGHESDLSLAPSSSKSRQKKFHRHFKSVPGEKVIDYYSCALVAEILLQGYLYITENYFAFYSNVFGYVTKVLIPVNNVVRITKERTAKVFPNAVGVYVIDGKKHVFASLLSRDNTFKLMYKVWNYTIEHEEILAVQQQREILEKEDNVSGLGVDESPENSESGSGNDSAEPSSLSPSPLSTPGIEKLVLAKGLGGVNKNNLSIQTNGNGKNISSKDIELLKSETIPAQPRDTNNMMANNSNTINLIKPHTSTANLNANMSSSSILPSAYIRAQRSSLAQSNLNYSGDIRREHKSIERSNGSNGPKLLILATSLLVVLFLSAAFLLSRISNLQERIQGRSMHLNHDSEQFYQELLTWQNKLHSSSAEEVHQYINANLQQIIKVRESLEALSLLFRPPPSESTNSVLSDATLKNCNR